MSSVTATFVQAKHSRIWLSHLLALFATLCAETCGDEVFFTFFTDRKRLCPDEHLLTYVLLVKLPGSFKEGLQQLS